MVSTRYRFRFSNGSRDGIRHKSRCSLGDFDRGFDPEIYKTSQYPIEIIHTPDQNKTDLEKAFDYLIERKIPAVNVVWATGRRADHTITNLTTNITRYRNLLKLSF
jgi:thiamine pyrophosphokinase